MKRSGLSYFFILCSIIAFSIGLIVFPQETSQSVRDALHLCANSVIPSLFPFFIVAKLVTSLRFAEVFAKFLNHIMHPLFSLSGTSANALVLGFIGGYPVGASTSASLYKSGACSKTETERILAFCNNCGPAFILGAVGSGVFSSPKVGIMLLIIHIFAAISVGLILRIFSPLKSEKLKTNHSNPKAVPSFATAFTDAVLSSLKASLSISSYIVLFSVIVRVAELLYLLPAISRFISFVTGSNEAITESVISGILEMTVGIYSLAECASFETTFIITAFFLGWGGISVHCQALSCLSECDLDVRQYFIGKLLHGVISAIYAYTLLHFSPTGVVPAFAPAFSDAFNINPIIVSASLIIIIFVFCKKGWKKAE